MAEICPAMAKEDKISCKSCTQAFHHAFERAFSALGSGIASHPWITIILSVLFVGACSAGFAVFQTEERAIELYTPSDNQGKQDIARGGKHFPLSARDEQVIILPKRGGNVLTRDCFADIMKVHNAIISVENFQTFCQRNMENKCRFANPLELFDFNISNIINVTSQLTSAYRNYNLKPMRNGRPFYLNFNSMFADVIWDSSTGALQGAAVAQIYYLIMDIQKEEANYEQMMKLEKDLLDKVRQIEASLEHVSVYMSTVRSVSDATAESSGSDLSLVAITLTLMCLFACVMLGKIRNPLTGHALLALIGILSVAFGIVSGLGLALWAQVPFVSIVGVLPFLIIGIGVDDMFIILDELDRVDTSMPVVDVVRKVMGKIGATVTMTTVTDLVAFAVSTSTEFKGIRYFCINAALAVTFSYLMLITFFIAFMSFDIKRMKANRRDCLPFCRARSPKDTNSPSDPPKLQISNKIMKIWAKVLMVKPVRVIIILISIGLLVAGVFGAMKVEEDFNSEILVKDGSPYKTYLNLRDKYFGNSFAVSIIIDAELNYENKSIQTQIESLTKIAKANKHYKNTSLSWLDEMTSFAKKTNITMTGAGFMPALKSFLGTPAYIHFNEDVKLSSDNTSIVASRVLCFIKRSTGSLFEKDAMLTLRDDLKTKSDLPVFATARVFMYWEQHVVIRREVIRNLAIAGGTVFVITIPFLLSICASFIVLLQFGALVVELFAIMWLWGVSLNSVSMINLVMAIGFSVDYCAHIAHAFVTSPEPRPEDRVISAMSTLGASVLMGGASTFIGVAVLGFASFELFRIFFKMFLGIILLGLLHGLVFLPVYLSVFCRWSSVKVNTSEELSNHKEGARNDAFENDKNTELRNATELEVPENQLNGIVNKDVHEQNADQIVYRGNDIKTLDLYEVS